MTNFDEKDLLARELRERSTDVGGHPIGFDAVRQSARKIRRRRNIVTGAVAAVVASVALPTGVAVVSAIDGPDGGKEPTVATGPKTDAPSADTTPAPAPTPRPDGSFPLTLRDIPRGEDPQVDYVLNSERMLVTPEGRYDLPEAYTQIVPYRDGWLALGESRNGFVNLVLDSEMNVLDRTLGGEGLALNADGSRVLMVQRDFNVPGRTVVEDRPAESDYEREAITYDAPSGRAIAPVGYLDEQRAVYQTLDGENLVIEMVVNDDDPHAVPLEGFGKVTSVSEATGLVAGSVEGTYDVMKGSCYGVMDPAASTTEMVFETCDYSLYEFSPDGRYVIAGPTYFDMWGPSELTVLDTETWKPVVEFSPEKDVIGQVAQATWEDEDTVAAIVVENDDFGIVRAELDGRLELTTGTYKSSDMSSQLWFAEKPRF